MTAIVKADGTICTQRVTRSGLLYGYLREQGCTRDQAEELLERKRKHPALTGVTLGGRWVSLSLPTAADAEMLTDMLESGVPPQSVTDKEFCAGRMWDEDQVVQQYRREAEAAGVSTNGAFYSSSLARFPGDPQAFVRDRGDAQKLIESRPGWTCDGLVKASGPKIDAPPPDISLGDDIVAERVMKKVAKNPDLARRPVEELKAEAKAEGMPHWKKKG